MGVVGLWQALKTASQADSTSKGSIGDRDGESGDAKFQNHGRTHFNLSVNMICLQIMICAAIPWKLQ